MPLVFVHGVNNRMDKEYLESQRDRDNYFRSISLVDYVADPAKLTIKNPYWGGDGASFAWDHACLPEGQYETFGGGDEVIEDIIAEMAPEGADTENQVLLTVARISLPRAIDCLWAAVGARAPSDAGTSLAVARLARKAMHYAASAPDLSWLANVSNDSVFVNKLLEKLEAWKEPADLSASAEGKTTETFGGPKIWALFTAAVAKIKGATSGAARRVAGGVVQLKNDVAAVVSRVATSVKDDTLDAAKAAGIAAAGPLADTFAKYGRSWAQHRAGLFIGDVFVYLDQRGRLEENSPILKKVIDDLDAADLARTTGDAKLILVGHSMGGNILYDILTHYRPKLRCDLFLTVGSQVAFFEELKLFRNSDKTIPNSTCKMVPKPENIGRWLNVFDPLDVFGYSTSKVFGGSRDFQFSTETNALSAHTMYFQRPHFHERLHERI